MEDWEAVDGLSDSLEKTLQVVSSHLPNKVVQTAAGTTEWIFLTALKVNMDSALHDATLVHNKQRGLEELEQCILALEQEPCGPEEPSISDSEVVSDSDDEHCETKNVDDERCETVGPRLTGGHCVAESEAWAAYSLGGHPQGAPDVTEFTTYWTYSQVELVDLGKQFQQT